MEAPKVGVRAVQMLRADAAPKPQLRTQNGEPHPAVARVLEVLPGSLDHLPLGDRLMGAMLSR